MAASFKDGDRVILAEFDNGDSIVPEQRGKVLGDEENSTYMVEIDPDCRQPDDVDGLVEATPDQMRLETD